METMDRTSGWYGGISTYLSNVFDEGLHAKRIESLANATLGVMSSGSLAVSLIGQALSESRGLNSKHAIKQVDRLLSNDGIDVWNLFEYWVPEQIGEQESISVIIDWTDFNDDDQATIAINMVTTNKYATPLLWLTVWKWELKDTRNEFEYVCIKRLSEVVPKGKKVTILADRGFGDRKLFKFIKELGFEYNIRIRGNINVTAPGGETRLAADWVGKGGRARRISGACVTTEQYEVGAVICVHDKGMKEPWCLVVSDRDISKKDAIKGYAVRWKIEPSFRDTKDIRFGVGLSKTHVSEPQRRDRILLLNAFAITLLTMLGAAGESLGMDRLLKVNTVKRRTHSLFRQGLMLYGLIPRMPEIKLKALIERFDELLRQSRVFMIILQSK